jgi:hypothetical protein
VLSWEVGRHQGRRASLRSPSPKFSQKIQLHQGLKRHNSCLHNSLSVTSETPLRHPLRSSPGCCPSCSLRRSDRRSGRCFPRCSDRCSPNRFPHRRPGCSPSHFPRCSPDRLARCGLSCRPRCSPCNSGRRPHCCSDNRFPSCPPGCSVHCCPGCGDSPNFGFTMPERRHKATESPGLSDRGGSWYGQGMPSALTSDASIGIQNASDY